MNKLLNFPVYKRIDIKFFNLFGTHLYPFLQPFFLNYNMAQIDINKFINYLDIPTELSPKDFIKNKYGPDVLNFIYQLISGIDFSN